MTDTELFKQIRDNNVSLDYIVVIYDILDNHTHFEVLTYELEYDLFTWSIDWYEGQEYTIIGYVPVDDLKLICDDELQLIIKGAVIE